MEDSRKLTSSISSQIAANRGGVKKDIATLAGVSPKDVNDESIGKIQEAAQTGDDSGMSPNQKLIAQALLAFVPTLVGAAVGGAQGGAAGAGAGITGLKAMQEGEESARKEKGQQAAFGLAQSKEALAERRVDQDMAFKNQQLALDSRKASAAENANQLAAGEKKGSQQIELAHKLRQERQGLPTTKATQEVVSGYQKILGAAENPSAAGDLSLIYGFMKMNDPGSTVREGEFATAQNATGIPEQLRNIYNKAISGERLGDAQRKDFISQAHNLYSAQAKIQDGVDKQYVALGQRAGLKPEDVLIGFSMPEGSQFAAGAQPQKPSGMGFPGTTSAHAAPPPVPAFNQMSDKDLDKFLGR